MPYKYSRQDLEDEFRRLNDLLGRPPSYEDVRNQGLISPKPFQTRFGTWENAKRELLGWIPAWELFEPKKIASVDGQWLAGLIDGEGCFTMRHPVTKHPAWDPLFTMSVRDDDEFMIDEVVRILGIKDTRVHFDYRKMERRTGKKGNPAVKITIYDIQSLHYHLIQTLKLYPLRSKKKNELKVFDLVVQTLLDKIESGRKPLRYNDYEKHILERCYYSLKALKQYKADYVTILQDLDLPID